MLEPKFLGISVQSQCSRVCGGFVGVPGACAQQILWGAELSGACGHQGPNLREQPGIPPPKGDLPCGALGRAEAA